MRKTTYHISRSHEVHIDDLVLGENHPLVIQSMANTNTLNIADSVKQCCEMADAGAQLVRLTAQGIREVHALEEIIASLRQQQSPIPVVADVHFKAEVAVEAAKVCSKVRINPGNFTERRKGKAEYSADEYRSQVEVNRNRLITLLDTCKKHNTALRIGVNHGSLSERIVSRYGDTPAGMVESAMEFLRVCREETFQHVVVSMKSSNTRLMVNAVRLLVSKMLEEDMYYPLHLGVTEAGDGLEGRIKSVVGIAPLLMEGMGDTIRVSLTENPADELAPANMIRELFQKPVSLPYHPFLNLPWNPFAFEKQRSHEMYMIGGENPPVVIGKDDDGPGLQPDIIVHQAGKLPLLTFDHSNHTLSDCLPGKQSTSDFIQITLRESPEKMAAMPYTKVLVMDATDASMIDIKQWIIDYRRNHGKHPLILQRKYDIKDRENYILLAAGEFALLLIDGLLNGIWIENPFMTPSFNNWFSFYLLQATRNRITSVEYISCPSCGRTLFDIQKVLKQVRQATAHLKGLRIAVMGCIVNGPGEMADADYGYIGAGKDLVSIYKGKKRIESNVPSAVAVKRLKDIIRENGDWTDP